MPARNGRAIPRTCQRLPLTAARTGCSARTSHRPVPPTGAGRHSGGLLLALALFLVGLAAAGAQPHFPALSGRIVDGAELLSPQDRRALEGELQALEAKSTDQVVVYTTRSLQGYPIEDFGYQLGRAWGIGQKGKDNGVILIVAPNERKVRIEVGRGLEPQLTDLLTKLIIENAIVPALRRNDYAGGIKAGVRDIRDVLLGDAAAVKERAKVAAKRSPAGGIFDPATLLALMIALAVVLVFVQSLRTAHPERMAADRRRLRGRGPPPSGAPGWGGPVWGGSAGGWEGGWGGGSSGGGFSGGGGDFGGGGSSGSW